MKILLYTSPTYSDDSIIRCWLQEIAEHAAGELVTVALHGGGSAAAREIIERSPESGLECEEWGDTISGIDEIVYLWQHPDYDPSFVAKADELDIPIMYEGDALVSER